MVIEGLFGPYLSAVVDGNNERKWNEETYDYDIPEMKEEMTGTLEEMVRFMAKTLEDEVLKLESVEEQTRISNMIRNISDMKMSEISPAENMTWTGGLSWKEFVKKNLANVFDPEYPGAFHYDMVAYQDWTSKMGDRLRDYLKDKVFFQKPKDNPLNGGHDILTFLVINPKVLKSPKINPLLRMSVTKDIIDFEDFDDHLFKFLRCFASEFGEGALVRFLDSSYHFMMEAIDQLENSYNANFLNSKPKDIKHWVDLADAIFLEATEMDIEDLFYRIYVVTLKLRAFILKLDVQNKIYPQYQRIKLLIQEGILRIKQNPKFVLSILKFIQKDEMWESGSVQDFYRRLLNSFDSPFCGGLWISNQPLLDCIGGALYSVDRWKHYPDANKVFTLEQTEDGEEVFAATRFFRNYRTKSLFKLRLDYLDPKQSVCKLLSYTEEVLSTLYRHPLHSIGSPLYNKREAGEFQLDW